MEIIGDFEGSHSNFPLSGARIPENFRNYTATPIFPLSGARVRLCEFDYRTFSCRIIIGGAYLRVSF
jgi:hypothetical protein